MIKLILSEALFFCQHPFSPPLSLQKLSFQQFQVCSFGNVFVSPPDFWSNKIIHTYTSYFTPPTYQ